MKTSQLPVPNFVLVAIAILPLGIVGIQLQQLRAAPCVPPFSAMEDGFTCPAAPSSSTNCTNQSQYACTGSASTNVAGAFRCRQITPPMSTKKCAAKTGNGGVIMQSKCWTSYRCIVIDGNCVQDTGVVHTADLMTDVDC